MLGKTHPQWAGIVEQWKAEQQRLRAQMRIEPLGQIPRYIAGADAAFSPDKTKVLAAAIVWDREERRVVEVSRTSRTVDVPYIPGFLSFREGPALTDAINALRHPFGAICFDGQGYAHPRRCGLAVHMAVSLGLVGLGVAKSRLVGTYEEPDEPAGSAAPLMDKSEQIGLVLRTRDRTRPLFISVGNRIDLAGAVRLTMACVTRYRVPEPTRQADLEVGRMKRGEP